MRCQQLALSFSMRQVSGAMSSSGQLQRVADGAGSLLTYTDLVLQHTSGPQRQQLLATIRQQMLEYARLQREVQVAADALQEVKDEAVMALTNGEETDLTQLTDLARQRTELRMAAVKKAELKGFDRYQELLQKQEAAGSGGDQELVMTETHVATLDPWTRQEIRQPYRNGRCGHLYDRSSLESVLQTRAKKPTCPYVGCTNKTPLRWEDLTEDSVAKQAIEKRKTQTQSV